eukprot:scaffold3297_cov327-Prasinococcus_capsulatus_cf.AAC.7
MSCACSSCFSVDCSLRWSQVREQLVSTSSRSCSRMWGRHWPLLERGGGLRGVNEGGGANHPLQRGSMLRRLPPARRAAAGHAQRTSISTAMRATQTRGAAPRTWRRAPPRPEAAAGRPRCCCRPPLLQQVGGVAARLQQLLEVLVGVEIRPQLARQLARQMLLPSGGALAAKHLQQVRRLPAALRDVPQPAQEVLAVRAPHDLHARQDVRRRAARHNHRGAPREPRRCPGTGGAPRREGRGGRLRASELHAPGKLLRSAAVSLRGPSRKRCSGSLSCRPGACARRRPSEGLTESSPCGSALRFPERPRYGWEGWRRAATALK